MNCIEYRRLITSEPSHVGAEGLRHRLACQSCAAYANKMQQFDTDLRDAMMVNTPRDLEAQILMAVAGQSSTRRRWVAMAATLVVAVGATLAMLAYGYRLEKLPDHVVKHMYHEANLMIPVSTDIVAAPKLRDVLERTGVRLNKEIDGVIHAGVCYFRGHRVSHLVVLSEQGPVTVMLLPDEQIKKTMTVDEDGFHGVIVPVDGGSIAIVGTDNAYPAQIERQLRRAVEWET